MEQTIYRIVLAITGLLNLVMAAQLWSRNRAYSRFPVYVRTRICTIIWLVAFGLGYLLHSWLQWRYTWPSAASALSVTYFHIAAVCFSWGYTSLLNPRYLNSRIVIRDLLIFIAGLAAYWTTAFVSPQATSYSQASFVVFFIYAGIGAYTFYSTYNRVSYRLIKMSLGKVSDFVHWMQICCDFIVLFGIASVAITAIFPEDVLPYTLLLIAGVGMFMFIVYSLSKYGSVIEKANNYITYGQNVENKQSHFLPNGLTRIGSTTLPVLLLCLLFAGCSEQPISNRNVGEADSLISKAYKERDYERLIALTNTPGLSDTKVNYWRGYAYSRLNKAKLAESYWKKATLLPIKSDDDLKYHAMSASRLAGILMIKDEYEATLRAVMPTIKALDEAGRNDDSDYANLLGIMGCCQLMTGNAEAAEKNFNRSTEKYRHIISVTNSVNDYNSAIACVIVVTDCYLRIKDFGKMMHWNGVFESLLKNYKNLSNVSPQIIDKQNARLNIYRACALEGLGQKDKARESYDSALTTQYVKTPEGMVEATAYLMLAQRWKETARNFEVLDQQMLKYDAAFSIENISHYWMPKLKANIAANNKDSALAVASRICNVFDSVLIRKQRDDAAELAIIYNIKQQETDFAQQKANLSRQRLHGTIITLILVILTASMLIYFRHKASLRLETAYQQLEIANARAEESSRMKTAFIRQVSHEIRTPLNILSGFTQVITSPDAPTDEATRQDINNRILENTDRITGLVNKMLELSDVNSRTVIERTDNVPAIQIATQAASDSGIGTKEHLTFDLQADEDTQNTMLVTNLQQAVRALTLILDNAQKYTRQGKVRLAMSRERSSIAFSVADTGIGVPPQEAEHIFEEFVQLDEYNVGTGIGLTVARSICRRLGGDVVLDTRYTRGARFIMTLPLS